MTGHREPLYVSQAAFDALRRENLVLVPERYGEKARAERQEGEAGHAFGRPVFITGEDPPPPLKETILEKGAGTEPVGPVHRVEVTNGFGLGIQIGLGIVVMLFLLGVAACALKTLSAF